MGKWSQAQNERSVIKAENRREKEAGKARKDRDAIRTEDIQRAATDLKQRVGDTPDQNSVRAVVEGDVYTYVPEAAEADRQLEKVQNQVFASSTELELLKPEFVAAWRDRGDAISAREAAAGRDRRVHTGGQSPYAVFAAAITLIALEAVFQRGPMERIVRINLPELSGIWITAVALVASVGLIGLATAGLYYAAKSWGEYVVRQARANDTARGVDGEIVGESVSAAGPFVSTAAALGLQVALFFLRFQSGTSGNADRSTLIFASVVIMLSASVVAVLEFRRSMAIEAAREEPLSRRDETINSFAALHQYVNATLPQEKTNIERRKYLAIVQFLRDLQRIGTINGPETQAALSSLVAEYNAKIEDLSKRNIDYKPGEFTKIADAN